MKKLLVVTVVLALLVSCGGGGGGGGSPTPGSDNSVTYSGTSSDSTKYTLTITNSSAKYAAKKGDGYVLTAGSKTSTGSVDDVSGKDITLAPQNGSGKITVTTSGSNGISSISKDGDVKWNNGDEFTEPGEFTSSSSTNPQSARFWAFNDETQKSYQLTAEMLADNARCEVWVERGSGVSQTQAAAIASEYSTKIYPKMINAFSQQVNVPGVGTFPDAMAIAYAIVESEIDKSITKKLTILVLDIKDGWKKDGDPYLAGYFVPRDFLSNTYVMGEDQDLRSNERPMIYMDTHPALSKGITDEFYSTIAHEMQHLMNLAVNMITKDKLVDLWINEGLSAAAEWVYSGEYNEDRITWFNYDPTQLIRRGNNFFVWGNRANASIDPDFKGSEILDDYATVYLFFQWLRLKSGGGGPEVYKKINYSEYYDYNAVVDAMSGYSNWPSLLEGWFKANVYGDYDSGLNSKIDGVFTAPAQTSINLYPGEGVYSVANSYTVPSSTTYINYVGLQQSGATTSGSFSGLLLTYNKNTNIEGSTAIGTTTGVAANIISSGKLPDSLRKSYAISRGDMIRLKGRNEKIFDLTVINSSKLFKGVLIE